MSIQINSETLYRARGGWKIGPLRHDGRHWRDAHGQAWADDGSYISGVMDDPMDIVAEWPTQPNIDADAVAALEAAIGAAEAKLDETKSARLKIYVSGPMSGYPGANYPLFNAVTALLRRAGHVVYNPAEFPHDGPKETFPLRKAFAEYAKFICEEADAIVLLPAWEASLGVSAELALAKNCKLAVYSFDNIETLLDAASVV